jgi:hypothetical protein
LQATCGGEYIKIRSPPKEVKVKGKAGKGGAGKRRSPWTTGPHRLPYFEKSVHAYVGVRVPR